MLSFVAYQLWGTSLAEARSQDRLVDEFLAQSAAVASGRSPAGGVASDPGDGDEATPPLPTGSAIAIIEIPKIGVTKAVIEGVTDNDLKKGPGHYPGTPLPGQPGNSAIAGHRTTYGAPFFSLDELEEGDPILIRTLEGSFRYEVTESVVVKPERIDVLAPTDDNRLTLTTCEPRFSAAKRLVVVAELVDDPAPAPAVPAEQPDEEAGGTDQPEAPPQTVPLSAQTGLSGEPASPLPAVVWGADTAVLALGIWRLSIRWRRRLAYVVGAPVFLVFLYMFFESFSRLLPANY